MITLIGMPGSGKSSAGRQIARRLSCPFIDCDHLLVAQFGMPIRDFFAQHGEAAFRDAEAAMLRQIVNEPSQGVLSTGGGAVLRPENRELLRASGTVVYLRVAPDELFRRLQRDTKRPLLQVDDPRKKVHGMLDERDPLYRETAHFVIDAGRGSVQTLINKVVMQLEVAGIYPRSPAA